MSDDRPVRVLVVDEWAVAAEQLRRDLSAVDGIDVVGVARSAEVAARLAADLGADVAAVDVGVRGGCGGVPCPAVAVCGDDRAAVSAALYAVERGAVDLWVRTGTIDDLADRLATAATANPARQPASAGPRAAGSAAGCVLVIGAGVGGTASLEAVLAALPADAAGVVVTALPAEAVALWTERFARHAAGRVAVATGVHRVAPGVVWVAPGDRHLTVQRVAGGGVAVVVRDGPLVGGHKPSLDVTFASAAACGPVVVAAVLGGGGADGVAGLHDVLEAGGRTAAESPHTATCGELPAAARRAGAAEVDAPAGDLAATLARLAGGQRSERAA